MSLDSNLTSFAQAVGADIKALRAAVATGAGGIAWTAVTDKPTFSTVATTGSYTDLTGRPTIPDTSTLAPKANPTFTGTVSGVTKAHVGLGNVDNTADTAKSFAGSQITSGTVPAARLGSGTASSSTVLYGDGTWKTAPTGGSTTLATALTGSVFRCPWNGSAWTYNGAAISARPSTRTDIYFDLVGAPVSASDPTWMLNGDTRTDVP